MPGTTRPSTGLRRSFILAQVYESRAQITRVRARCYSPRILKAREVMKRIATIAVGLLVAHGASAGVYVEQETHNRATNTSKLSQKIYVQNGAGRFVDAEGHTSLIKEGTLYIIDDA